MYNGIGLNTARGSGTNGFVTRNLSHVRVTKEVVDYKPDEEIQKLEAYINRKGNKEILIHEKKREVEVKCVEVEELMEEQGYPQEEIDKKVGQFRKILLDKIKKEETASENKKTNRSDIRESHQAAEATDEKNRKFRQAFGIRDKTQIDLDKEKEAAKREENEKAKEMLKRKYVLELDDVETKEKKEKKDKKEKKEKSKRTSE